MQKLAVDIGDITAVMVAISRPATARTLVVIPATTVTPLDTARPAAAARQEAAAPPVAAVQVDVRAARAAFRLLRRATRPGDQPVLLRPMDLTNQARISPVRIGLARWGVLLSPITSIGMMLIATRILTMSIATE